MIKKVFIFGNIGKMSELPKSGGQTSARRVIAGLKKMGYDLEPIVRRRCALEGRLIHFLETQSFAVIDLIKIGKHIMFGNRKKSVFLTLTYGGKLVPYELLITFCVRILGFKCITYMKGGQFMDFYNKGSNFYKWMVKTNMNLQCQAWFEGMPSLDIVKQISNTHLVYYPNYVFEENIVETITDRPKDQVNLCYFGRISPDKNVDVVIRAFELLCEKFDNIFLTIVGGTGHSKQYVEDINSMIQTSKYRSHITRKGITPFSEIKDIMQLQHFFVFPSKERCEGHSNSLNEAMAQGLVPIVSDYHFNRAIVGDSRLVVDGFDPKAYAAVISKIIEKGCWQELSDLSWNRVKNNFSHSLVNERIYTELKKI